MVIKECITQNDLRKIFQWRPVKYTGKSAHAGPEPASQLLPGVLKKKD